MNVQGSSGKHLSGYAVWFGGFSAITCQHRRDRSIGRETPTRATRLEALASGLCSALRSVHHYDGNSAVPGILRVVGDQQLAIRDTLDAAEALFIDPVAQQCLARGFGTSGR